METENATLNFHSREMAKQFITRGAYMILKGRSMYATSPNGYTTVKLYDINDTNKIEINKILEQLRKANY